MAKDKVTIKWEPVSVPVYKPVKFWTAIGRWLRGKKFSLQECVTIPGGTLEVDIGEVLYPYIDWTDNRIKFEIKRIGQYGVRESSKDRVVAGL